MDAQGLAFVTKAFQDLLNRAPETAAANYYSGLLDQGVSRGQVALDIESTQEYATHFVDQAYVTYLKRTADPAGEANAVQLLLNSGSQEQVLALLTNSNEYFQTRGAGTNDGYLNALFQDFLNRPIDSGSLSYFDAQLASGATHEQIFTAIYDNSEARRVTVNGLFQQFLNRPADQAGSNTFLAALTQGFTVPQVTASILSTAEFSPFAPGSLPAPANDILPAPEVTQLLARASAATPSNDGIIVIVDRGGNILGVSVENGVSSLITSNPATKAFAIDGAVAEARTGAFFGNDTAPLTSRTIQFISQTTVTQRMVDSSPDVTDLNSPLYGPGAVAPIQIGGHFPPGVLNTPFADLFGIEFTNRDSSVTGPGASGERFNIDPAYIPVAIPTQDDLNAPDSYGVVSGIDPTAQGRGIGTLPGGLPIYRNGVLVGGIGVFYPGTTGYASAENSSLSSNFNPNLPDRSLEAEYAGLAALGGLPAFGLPINNLGGIAPLSDISYALVPGIFITQGSITLPLLGNATAAGPVGLITYGTVLGQGTNTGVLQPITPAAGTTTKDGVPVPSGWLVLPHDGVGITGAQVNQIINQGILQATQTRAAIRLPAGTSARMTLAVSDKDGNIVGLYRMPDSTVFSIGVAVAKARNTAYYNNASELQPVDQLPGVAAGFAFTNRTFRYLTEPNFPEGPGANPGIWSALNDPSIDPRTGLNIGPALPMSAYTSMEDFFAFNPRANFHDPNDPLNQNGVVLFPGSSAVYSFNNGFYSLIGGFGVSGDGVNQDDVVTAIGITGFTPPNSLLISNVIFRGVSLPYQNFDRNPTGA